MNRRVLVVVGVVAGVLVVLGIVGALSGGGTAGDEAALRRIGPPAAEVCRPETSVAPSGASQHVNGDVEYDRSPPNSGPHHPNWVSVLKRVYTAADALPPERVVHNLEHGYVVVWYDPARVDGAALSNALEAAELRKAFGVPWTRGPMPAAYVLAAWGHERACDDVSGEALADFIAAHGGENGDAPEPTAP